MMNVDANHEINEMGLHTRSKTEAYGFLVTVGKAYLPPIDMTNQDFTADVVQARKKVSCTHHSL